MYNKTMDRKSKILLYFSFFLFITTVMFSYARYMVFHDFEVTMSEDAGGAAFDEMGISPTEGKIGTSPETALQ